ncbi:sulfite exporter TauE/SafE family protein [Paracoccus sp. MC1862]|nr:MULTISPECIES: sulfite exporter TauE/SafE family protein [unclassified Paracoccus (in: a-proteobacteria)]MBB1491702.1 sulfite exporter TauE/SafE family protein [Paracoccus sp. MC1854]MBB1499240.1 sulfite exporter TauE/SafE family protein [Paracoccus sp. MC1862]QQO46225.1 sulfite exporter TauE/SafE family protein [Paracoccus sp. MC1862]
MFGLDPHLVLLAATATLVAGLVKGAIGFAMPMILMSALGSFLPAPVALALSILPMLVTNVQQATRQGIGAAMTSVRAFRWHIGALVLFIFVSAPFARILPQPVMYLALGVPILGFALWQLSGRPMALPVHHHRRAEILSGVVGGLYGGISGIWGPPLIVYLLSIGVSKLDQIRVQGVVFLVGAVALALAHLGSGVLNAQTLPLSALMVVPAVIGMQMGFWLQDRLDLAQFRRWTLLLLALTSLNLIRRGIEVMG